MIERPGPDEAAEYLFRYIDLVEDDALLVLEQQMDVCSTKFQHLSEEAAQTRYAAGKWSVKQMLNHISDTERIFVYRALWFARGLPGGLPSFDQDIAVANAGADFGEWAQHLEEFRRVRQSTLSFFLNLPREAWSRSGEASGKRITVKALAYLTAGHFAHHMKIFDQHYAPAIERSGQKA